MASLVIHVKPKPRVYFGDLEVGSVFRIVNHSTLWMKVQPILSGDDVLYNALYLSDSKYTLFRIEDEDEVDSARSELSVYFSK